MTGDPPDCRFALKRGNFRDPPNPRRKSWRRLGLKKRNIQGFTQELREAKRVRMVKVVPEKRNK